MIFFIISIIISLILVIANLFIWNSYIDEKRKLEKTFDEYDEIIKKLEGGE